MLPLTLLPLLLATAGFAAPSNRATVSDVPVSALSLPPNQRRLVAPPNSPSFVTVAVGTQNYTCSQNGSWVSNGAFAELWDITSLYSGSEFSTIQKDIYGDWATSQSSNPSDSSFVAQIDSKYGVTHSGQYYFIADNVGNLSPVVDFRSSGVTAGDLRAIVVAKVTGDIQSPDSTANIDWQEMASVSGQLANTIFLVYTKGGELAVDDACGSGSADNAVKFTAQIWLYDSAI